MLSTKQGEGSRRGHCENSRSPVDTSNVDIHLFTEMTESKESEWVRRYQLSWAEWAGVRVLRRGRVPRHIAVIMDGNRRYARMAGTEVSEVTGLPNATINNGILLIS